MDMNYCTHQIISYSIHHLASVASANLLSLKLAPKEKQISHLHYSYTNTELHRLRLKRMACVVVLSLMRTLELEFLQPLPRPILQQKELIPCNKHLVLSLHNKLGFLMDQFDENRMDGVEAIKNLETKLRDVSFRIEDEIELQVVHIYEEEREEEEEEFRIFAGIFDIFDRFVDETFQPLKNDIYVEMPQGEKSTHHCQSLHQTSTHHCQRLHQILHPLRGKSHTCLKFRRILHRAVQHIDAITEELAKAKEEYQLFEHHLQAGTKQPASLHVLPIPSNQGIAMPDSSHTASHTKEIMVGKQDEFKIIKEKLIQHPSKQREVVSIKGMGGIGKTILAKKIYEDPSITSHFDKQAWTVASQHHSQRQMLLDLLGFKDNNAANSSKATNEELALRLYQSLKHQRYLVVMDDVWSKEAWDIVKTCFPDDGNGSRVFLTTRLAEVANHTCSKDDFSHQMQLLDQSESWELFNEKTCESHGAEFETIGRSVVEKCKGLPLAIIVVAGLFSKLNTLDEWKNTANALISSSSATTLDDEECSRILSLSYNHLPHNLKACFLYLGVFPEDHEINANLLAKFWLAEGLVKAFENESFDAVANRYMQELMDRNLIILSELSCCGRKIKRFRMHDLLHAFCMREAQNENLLHVVESQNSSYFPQKGFRWVSIQYEGFNMSTIQHYTLKSYRSVFSFLWQQASSDFINGDLLRVLFYYHRSVWLKNIVNTVHLRFLRVVDNIELSSAQGFLKSRRRESVEFSRSWNLQTLSCLGNVSYRLDEGVKYLEFPQLHYINCKNYFSGNPPNFVQNLHTIRADHSSEEYITNIPCLKKVRIKGKGREINACIANLAYLEQLEGLWISRLLGTHTPINNDIVPLKNLRKLVLFGMRFEWGEINILSKLPRLEVLKLLWKSCIGKVWEIQEEVIFYQLIALVILDCDLKHWKASSHNFPKLEHLFLWNCYNLREIPIDFAEISTLKSIKLRLCHLSAVESAKKIQDEQRDYGNYNMVVIEEKTRCFEI